MRTIILSDNPADAWAQLMIIFFIFLAVVIAVFLGMTLMIDRIDRGG